MTWRAVMCGWLRLARHEPATCGAGMGYRCIHCGTYGQTQLELLGEEDKVRVDHARYRIEGRAA